MYHYLFKDNDTNERYECDAPSFDQAILLCLRNHGTDDVLLLKKTNILEVQP